MPLRRELRWCLVAALFVWAFGMRAWFASTELDAGRFWDERYSLASISRILQQGSFEPANGYHPSLSYLPQAGLLAAMDGLHRLTGSPALAVFSGDGFSPSAYLACRLSQAAAGIATLWLTFLIGRRLFDSETGWVAAFLVAVAPWHLRQSSVLKPDIMLLLTCLVAFYLALRTLDRPSTGRYLAAGAAVGLALSTKFNAGPIAIPLIVATVVQIRRDRRVIFRLVLAGLAAVAVFLILNPYVVLDPAIYTRSFGATLRDYARKGASDGDGTHLNVLRHGVKGLLGSSFHGPVVGALGLAGLLALLVKGWRTRHTALGAWMLPAYAFGYAALYVASTKNPTAHNWLPVLPYTALAAAWLAVLAGRRLATHWAPARDRRLVSVVLVGLGAVLCWPSHAMVYREVVPTTAARAGVLAYRALPSPPAGFVYQESAVELVNAGRSALSNRAVVRAVERLPDIAARRLGRADAEVFAASRLTGEGAPPYLERVARVDPGRVSRFAPRWLRTRGPELVVILHPWRRGLPRPVWVRFASAEDSPRRYVATLPEELRRFRYFSLRLGLGRRDLRRREWLLHLDGEPLHAVRLKGSRDYYSERVRLDAAGEIALELPAGMRAPRELAVGVLAWRPPLRP